MLILLIRLRLTYVILLLSKRTMLIFPIRLRLTYIILLLSKCTMLILPIRLRLTYVILLLSKRTMLILLIRLRLRYVIFAFKTHYANLAHQAPSYRLDRVPEDEWIEDYYEDYVSEDEMEDYSTKPVPIWLSVCLVIAYIIGGAFIFQVLSDGRCRECEFSVTKWLDYLHNLAF